jgi:hypothetical protein
MASDCLEVVNMMQEGGYSLGIAAAVIDDCYHLATEFPKVIFEFCYREANSVAHEVARVARGTPGQVWLEKPQSSLYHFC